MYLGRLWLLFKLQATEDLKRVLLLKACLLMREEEHHLATLRSAYSRLKSLFILSKMGIALVGK